MSITVLLRITGRTTGGRIPFVAGVTVKDGVVVTTAPILKFARGWYVTEFIKRCVANHWVLEVIHEKTEDHDVNGGEKP